MRYTFAIEALSVLLIAGSVLGSNWERGSVQTYEMNVAFNGKAPSWGAVGPESENQEARPCSIAKSGRVIATRPSSCRACVIACRGKQIARQRPVQRVLNLRSRRQVHFALRGWSLIRMSFGFGLPFCRTTGTNCQRSPIRRY